MAKTKKQIKSATAAAKGSAKAKGASAATHLMTYAKRSAANMNFKPRRPFGDPLAPNKPDPSFAEIPSFNKMPKDLSYDLEQAIGKSEVKRITDAGQMVFHIVGDTGDINSLGITKDLSDQMESQYSTGDKNNPAFLYILGDLVYYNGAATDYRDQFYDPYKNYPNVIMAVPGNHDGQTVVNKGNAPDNEPSLYGYFRNMCDKKRTKTESSPYRYSMDLPWPYWVLNTPYATIIGLYSNVDGTLDKWNDKKQPQFNWFVEQLRKADKNKCVMLTLHHPPYSLDGEHGGYPDILDTIDQAVEKAGGRYPDIIFSGHVHNYQRFQRKVKGAEVPHIIAGAGGYASLKTMHKLQVDPKTKKKIQASPAKPFRTTLPDVQLMQYNEDLPGFMRITVNNKTIKGEYFVNTTTGGQQSTKPYDSFVFDLVKKEMK